MLALVLLLAPAAGLTVSPPVHDGGRVYTGTVLRPTFTLTNTEAVPIHVLGAKPSCGCLRVECPAKTLAPGASMTMSAEVHTVTQADGAGSWRAAVRYRVADAAEEHAADADVRAHLTARLSIRPASVVIHAGGVASHPLTLVEHTERPATVTAVTVGTGANATVSVGGVEKRGATHVRTLTLTTTATGPAGTHVEMLRVHTDDPAFPTLCVPVTVVRKSAGKLSSLPATVNLTGAGSRVMQIAAADDSAVKLTRVECTHPALRCTFAAGPGTRATVRVVADADKLPADGVEAKVRVYTEGAAGPALEVPVRVGR